ncbi:MAG: hypothetical protein ABIP51_21555 [Bacteroidia bacterium]
MGLYATKLKQLFDRIGTTAAVYLAKHPAGKRNGKGKMKTEGLSILPEYSSFVASAITETQITLTWSGITGASSHTLIQSTDSHFKTNLATVYTGASLTANATGLTAGKRYYFKVTSGGTGKAGSLATISSTTLGTLAAPATFVASSVLATSLTLTWAAVTGATGYVVERATNVGFSAGLTTVYTGALLTTSSTGLTTATQYFYRVKATAAGHTGVTYATLNVTTA